MHIRDPDSYTPCLDSGRSLLLGADAAENSRQISQFSKRDAEVSVHVFNIDMDDEMVQIVFQLSIGV